MTKLEARNEIIKYCREIDWYSMHISDIEKGIDEILEKYGQAEQSEREVDLAYGLIINEFTPRQLADELGLWQTVDGLWMKPDEF